MRIILESTQAIIDLNGTPARIWTGATESGVKIDAFIPLIAAHESQDQEQLKAELSELIPLIPPNFIITDIS